MSAEPPRFRRGPVLLIALCAAAWVALLGGMVITSANPIVVNRLQVQSAHVIVQGVWHPGTPARITVERSWKRPLDGEIKVREPQGISPSGQLIVPLTRIGPDLYEVTQGELPTVPEHAPRAEIPEKARAADVRPLVYPVTPDVIRQIDELLGADEQR